MTKTCLAFLLPIALGASACAPWRWTAPVADVPYVPPASVPRLPLGAVLVLPPEDGMAGVTEPRFRAAIEVPYGKLMRRYAPEALSQVFGAVQLSGSGEEAPRESVAVRLGIPEVGIVSPERSNAVYFVGTFVMEATVTDASGTRIWSRTVRGEGRSRQTSVRSKYPRLTGDAVAQAAANAFAELAREIAIAPELAVHARRPGRPGASEAKTPRLGDPSGRLQEAFEAGLITTGQLDKALEELRNGTPSRTLGAFLSGELGGRQFGEVYR